MQKKAVIAALLLLAVGGVAFAAVRRQQGGAVVEEFSPDTSGDVVNLVPYAGDVTAWWSDVETSIEQNFLEIEANTMPTTLPPYLPSQIAAMQEIISKAEGTAERGDPYRVCFGYVHTIASFADHPAITKEWTGERLSDAICAGAGYGPGCKSTAAGKYQIKLSTWNGVKSKLGLVDFSPASQDAACVELLRQRGALPYLGRGDFVGAVRAARKEWASLPGAGYGQGERSIAWLTQKFTAAGGVLA